MRQLLPESVPSFGDDDLERLYDYPAGLDRARVHVNMVSSTDGAVEVDGLSQGLSGPADKRVFAMNRTLADVVLVGWGTARDEGYRGVKAGEVRAARRERLGLAPVPPIAVVTAHCSVPPDSPLLTDTLVPPIVITTASAPLERRAAVAEGGADVVVAGDTEIDLRRALDALAGRGLHRVSCEGGPTLFASLIAEDLVDALCLTMSPMMAGSGASRLVRGGGDARPLRLGLRSVLEDDGFLMLRYTRDGMR